MYEIQQQNDDQPDLVIAELLGVINKMSHGNKRLEGIIRSYETIARGYDYKAATLRDERDRAREVAVMLEQECNECWGPVHTQTIEAVKRAMLLWGEWDGA
jgi:hypothetical protein